MLLLSENAHSGDTFGKLPSLSATIKSYWPLIFFILIGACHGVIAARKMELQHSEVSIPTHSNFFRFALRGRQRALSCAGNPMVCANREKNPWGGDTCCFGRYCKDTTRDVSHCGMCGHACAYGLVCCGGECVDVQSDPHNCGSCFEECPAKSTCSYAMCDYGG
ncbi:hypothetical protein ACJRO7_032424 [Eucalyptus globulus]|uniref:Stigma-specific Stig1 family protein n=1 Tax=Eucalyptus globulus TaxID=34317 RepID=A0ABD3JL43_EUCGL